MVISSKLIIGIKGGSYEDFETFYHLFSAKLYHFVMKLSGGDSAMAEEVVQMTFIKLWETRETLDENRNIITYVCTIARNILLNHYKHRTLKWVYEEFVMLSQNESDCSTEQNLDVTFLEQYISNIVTKLPPACRRIFEMSRNQGLNNREIARELGLSEKTVEAQLTKALSVLRNNLKKI